MSHGSAPSKEPDDGIDPDTLPPATAPPSAPAINPNVVGMFDGRSILEVDLSAMADKPWRRPGSDISDWFNYGFDELSWEAYCHRRREIGEVANVLKANVIVSLPRCSSMKSGSTFGCRISPDYKKINSLRFHLKSGRW